MLGGRRKGRQDSPPCEKRRGQREMRQMVQFITAAPNRTQGGRLEPTQPPMGPKVKKGMEEEAAREGGMTTERTECDRARGRCVARGWERSAA